MINMIDFDYILNSYKPLNFRQVVRLERYPCQGQLGVKLSATRPDETTRYHKKRFNSKGKTCSIVSLRKTGFQINLGDTFYFIISVFEFYGFPMNTNFVLEIVYLISFEDLKCSKMCF